MTVKTEETKVQAKQPEEQAEQQTEASPEQVAVQPEQSEPEKEPEENEPQGSENLGGHPEKTYSKDEVELLLQERLKNNRIELDALKDQAAKTSELADKVEKLERERILLDTSIKTGLDVELLGKMRWETKEELEEVTGLLRSRIPSADDNLAARQTSLPKKDIGSSFKSFLNDND